MGAWDYRFGVLATVCAVIGGYLFLVDIGETPLVFENAKAELVFLAPLLVWLLGRSLYLWPRRGPRI